MAQKKTIKELERQVKRLRMKNKLREEEAKKLKEEKAKRKKLEKEIKELKSNRYVSTIKKSIYSGSKKIYKKGKPSVKRVGSRLLSKLDKAVGYKK